MGDRIAIDKESVTGAIENLRAAAGMAQTRIRNPKGRSELETLERYREDLERMSSLLESCRKLLEEDCGRLEESIQNFFWFEAGLVMESLAGRGPAGQ